MFKALLLEQVENKTVASIYHLPLSSLPVHPGDTVTIDVMYSSINYKDALAVIGAGNIIKKFPMVPGIDCAGVVTHSDDLRYSIGDHVIVTGWGAGERYWGGLAENIVANGDWLVPMPHGFDSRRAMVVGTAGLTSMLCVQALLDAGITPQSGEILVTGACGGVASIAIRLLAQLGFRIAAVTGRAEQNREWLTSLGVETIIERNELTRSAAPLETSRWAGAIDTAGGTILAKLLSQMKYGGVVAACGLAASARLETTVMPFILRGVSLVGIDSVQCPTEKRIAAWNQLAKLLPADFYREVSTEIELESVPEVSKQLLQGQIKGRVIVKL